MSIVICDIDGTIAHHTDEQRGHFDYHLVGGDAPILPIIELVELLWERHRVVFLSGREDSCFDETRRWLRTHVPSALSRGVELYMRPTGNRERDDLLKRRLYDLRIAPIGEPVAYVLEDRNRNVAMWRSLGFTCLQVADGDF